ncbi:hypothetical protein LIER_39383 [Lithospermum erythrorhizon]|uniref:Uncharacterized protein n=1 Tax=Lithospermum erythrorhizon TaxID=34254 RepID=A0AAV3QE29_LITER
MTKPPYVRRRNYRRVYNPKVAPPSQIPKPADSIASTLTSIPENKDDFEKFPKPVVRKGGVIQKWMQNLYQKKNVIEEVVQTKNPFASLSEDQVVNVQPEPTVGYITLIGASLHEGEKDHGLLSSEPAEFEDDTTLHGETSAMVLHRDEGDNLGGVKGSGADQCGEVLSQFGDTKVEVAAINFAGINVTFHVDSAPPSPNAPERLDIICPESVVQEENPALEEDVTAQHIDKSLHSSYNVE